MPDAKDWRLKMLQVCGPGVLAGIRLGDWVKLLREERRQIDLSRLPRVVSITVQSLKNSAVGEFERRRFAATLQKVVVQPPIFLLGHWRSGTTHLHQLLCQDQRFAFPTTYQTAFPHVFLSLESVEARLLGPFMPACRPMDNMGLTLASPQEDEFALCGSSLRSSCMQWVFPRQKEKFRKYLTFRKADQADLAAWREAFLVFLKKLQWRYGRPLLLKSPQHTARIGLLLELFPDAKFVHIHRNPFRVFQSSRELFRILFAWHGLQRPELETLDDWVLEQYREMYDAFFEQQPLVPAARFHELSFEELERDPIGQIRRLYEALNLPDFSPIEPKLRHYVESLAGYRKNRFSDLPAELKQRISREWGVCFEKWGYPNQ
jgi:omega-hydroxy-beta-dihydromenaquinone-9 sulfotransferase